MKRNLKRLLSLVLTLGMLITMIPATVFAETDTMAYRIFHLDAGRKYFSVEQIEGIIDTMAENGYNYLELAVGNDGLRFLLDDMAVTAGETTYTSEKVTAGIQAGNKAYYNAGTNELTQAEMDTIIDYAKGKKIGIIPLINTPGHMDAILDCMESVGISNPAYSNSARTVNVTNAEAVDFTLALVNKYIKYFAGKGCTIFNMGCDEYANDVSNSGFAGLISAGKYGTFVDYVNKMATQVKAAGMTPMAFNDGIYYNSNTSGGTFDNDIMVAYWTSGWGGYTPASASFLAGKGHKIINTNDAWYYVLGRQAGNSSGYTIATAQQGVQSTKCTDVPGDTDTTPAGCMLCLWCDTPSASYSDAEAANVAGLISTFAENNPDYFKTSTDTPDPVDPIKPTDPVEVTEEKTITVTVGGTATATIYDANYAGDYNTDNSSIATVEVMGKDAVEATTTYTQASATCNTLISSDSNNWQTVSGYYYKAEDGNYYPVYAKRSSKGYIWKSYTYTWGYSTTSSASNVTQIGTQETRDTSTTANITVYKESGTAAVPASTTVTFKGMAAGTTYVTVGNTRYTINVVAEDLSRVTPLPVEYWITNLPVTADGATSKKISAQSVYDERGVDISTLVPKTGSYTYGSVVYWKGTVLDADNKQTTASGAENDKTGAGEDFSLIRYYDGKWQYFYDKGKEWKTINNTDQVVIYWLQPTEVTQEITTLVKDWGYAPSNQGNDGNNKVALTVAVVYPDGTVSPAEGNMYSNSTTLFNYWKNRDIGLVAPVNNSDYEISKITVTDGKRDQSGTGQWGANDTITWEKTTNEAGTEWYNETAYWTEKDGGTPMVNGLTRNITWSNYNTAKLVLIYLKPVHYDTNLVVKWVDDSAGGAEISSMEVAVSSDGKATTFYNGLKQTSALPTEGVGGTFTLDDNAYVTNSSNVNQPFNKNIATIPGVDAKYTSGLYKYVSAELSADGKTMTLHYNLDSSKLSKNYVVDFGLPVTVPLSNLVEHAENVTKVSSSNTNIKVNDNNSITFTPSGVMTAAETAQITLEFGTDSEKITIGFTPATTVYYEEGFAQYTKGEIVGTALPNSQTASAAGTAIDTDANYGRDDSYSDDEAGDSNGTSVKLETGGEGTFTFKGTGVEIYTRSTPETGKVMAYLYKGNTLQDLYTVDTKMATGTSEVTSGQRVNGYNVPIISITGLESAEYTVKLLVVQTKNDDGTKVVKPVYVDGFRVHYDSTYNDIYENDGEKNPQYVELRNRVLAGLNANATESEYANEIATGLESQVYAKSDGVGAVVISDNVDPYIDKNVQDLLDNGPKNEIYLYPGQALTFNLAGNYTNLQLGLKALDDSVTYKINNSENKALTTSTDMFYTVEERTITVTNTANSEGILAVTKLKLCGAESASSVAFAPLCANDFMPALMSLGFEVEPTVEYADATANINLVDYTGSTIATTALTANGEKGTEAVFTAADIQTAAEQLLPEGYAFADGSAITDQTVTCGESADVKVQIGKVATLKVTYKTLFGKTSGTATLTAVQTSSAASYTFSASEIRKAAPGGYWAGTLIPTKVKYGSTGTRTVIGL